MFITAGQMNFCASISHVINEVVYLNEVVNTLSAFEEYGHLKSKLSLKPGFWWEFFLPCTSNHHRLILLTLWNESAFCYYKRWKKDDFWNDYISTETEGLLDDSPLVRRAHWDCSAEVFGDLELEVLRLLRDQASRYLLTMISGQGREGESAAAPVSDATPQAPVLCVRAVACPLVVPEGKMGLQPQCIFQFCVDSPLPLLYPVTLCLQGWTELCPDRPAECWAKVRQVAAVRL